MNDVDREALAYMERDAANGKESFISNEHARNEAAVAAAIFFDKENRTAEAPVLTTEDVAKGIYSRVSQVLSVFANVNAVCNGKVNTGAVAAAGEPMVAELCAMGYFYPTERTNFAETKHILTTDIKRYKESGQDDKAQTLTEELAKVEAGMMAAAIPVIVSGLEDGSIDPQLASKTDEEIVLTLIASDNTKEVQIQEAFNPVMKNAFIEEAHIACSSSAETPAE